MGQNEVLAVPAAADRLKGRRGDPPQKGGLGQPAAKLVAVQVLDRRFVQDREAAVAGQGLALGQPDLVQRLAPDRLDRVAEDVGQPRGHFLALRLGRPARMLPNRSGRWPCIDMIPYCWMIVMVLLVIQ